VRKCAVCYLNYPLRSRDGHFHLVRAFMWRALPRTERAIYEVIWKLKFTSARSSGNAVGVESRKWVGKEQSRGLDCFYAYRTFQLPTGFGTRYHNARSWQHLRETGASAINSAREDKSLAIVIRALPPGDLWSSRSVNCHRETPSWFYISVPDHLLHAGRVMRY